MLRRVLFPWPRSTLAALGLAESMKKGPDAANVGSDTEDVRVGTMKARCYCFKTGGGGWRSRGKGSPRGKRGTRWLPSGGKGRLLDAGSQAAGPGHI